MDKKGQLFVLLVYLLGIVIIGLTMVVLSGPMKTIFDDVANDPQVQDEDYQTFYTRTKTIWLWLPLMLIFPMILWSLSKPHERGGYG
jgi:H+/Cl- antiporter ClcA